MLLPLLFLAQLSPQAQADYRKFAAERRGECVGPPGRVAPIPLTVGGQSYRLLGDRLEQQGSDSDFVLRIGVISASRDDREQTLAAIRALHAQAAQGGLDVVVMNGDLATQDIDFEDTLFPALAALPVLVVVHAGNAESCGVFNDSATATFLKAGNLINGNWVRTLVFDDGALVTLPGYFDKRFVHSVSAARYDATDLEALSKLWAQTPDPKLLVSHGPPRMTGAAGLDITYDDAHVGDPDLATWIREEKVTFGIFGHILESGGRGSDADGKKVKKPDLWHRDLFVNAGTANPDPWTMLGGKTSYGMGLKVELDAKKKQARYKVLRLSKP